jgi:hypothetical protein
MTKKIILLLLAACLLIPSAVAEEANAALQLEMHPGETMAAPAADKWESTDAQVAAVDEKGNITAVSEGDCQILLTTGGATTTYELTVDDNIPTELMKKAIAIAENEFVTLDLKGIKRANKYTKWYSGKDGVAFGWCGAFVGWCFEEAGVPMSRVGKAEKVADDLTYAIGEAAVGKILKGYQKMERTTNIPRPGYMVIYSVTNKSYNNIHTGLVADVEDLGDGRYLLTTVEGNVSSTVKKYQYYYDSSEEATQKQENMQALPSDMQLEEKICYKLHSEDWFVKVFCQTYK